MKWNFSSMMRHGLSQVLANLAHTQQGGKT